VERIPAKWAEEVERRVAAGRELQDAVREVLAANVQLLVCSKAKRMVISQDQLGWVDLRTPTGSGQVSARPVVVVQCDALDRSHLATTVCVPLSSNVKWGPSACHLQPHLSRPL
jgi:PemK-like, MazF-like toxin of type II toxin-antitoxin system